MSEWIPTKTVLPPEKFRMLAKNTEAESISWIDGYNDLGKPAWCHESWEHADDFVSHWKPIPVKDIIKRSVGKNIAFIGSFKHFTNLEEDIKKEKIIVLNDLKYVRNMNQIRGMTDGIIVIDIHFKESDDDLLAYIKGLLVNQNEVYIVHC